MARLVEIQREFRIPQVGMTGGRIAIKAYRRLAAEGARSAVDWSRVELWWSDERFVPAGHEERNDTQVLALLVGPLRLSSGGIHPMPARDADLDLDQAAEDYAPMR